MATIRDILGDDTLKFENNFKKQGLQGKDLENAMIKLARDTRTQRENEQKQLQEQKNQVAEGYANDFNSLFMGDNASSQVLRGLATGGNRLLAGANYLADKVGFDLLDNKTTNNLNEMQNLFDKKKEDISRENVSPERLAELQKLDTNNQNATGIIDNLSAGVSTMVDTLTHPSEWTLQGVTETVTDPLNALSIGAGSLASKLGRTMLQKTALGATGGAIEGATVNAGGEYIIAKGQDKTDNEASKIALQGLGGGVVAGGAFGAIGGAVSGYTPQVKEKLDSIKSKSVDEILDNELLKDLDSVQGEIINPEINSSYPKVDDKFKIEQAGQTPPPTPPNFRMVYDNLPSIFTPEQIDKIDTRMNDFAVQEQFKIESIFPEIKENYTPNFRFVSDKLPSILRELVDTEIIDEPTAKQIEYKNKTILLGHKDIIYAGMNGWKESVNQSIIDAINGNKISKMKRTEDISNQATLQSQQLAKTLAEQGADATTIKDTINNKIIPTKDELDFTNILNDGMPVENRFAGARLRNAIQKSISNPVRTPEQFASILKSAGFNDGVVKIATQSYINKNLDSFDDYITSKISKTNDEQIKAITKKIDDEIIITEDNLQEWLKANPVIKNDTPEMSYRNAVDELQNILNKSPESITDENLTKFIKDRYGDDGIKLHKNFTKQVELESKADDLHNTILDIEDEIASLKDEKDSIADNPNATKEDIVNYDKEILKLEKEVQNLSKQKASFDNKIQDLVSESFQIEKAVTVKKYPKYAKSDINGNNRIDYDKLQEDGLSTLTYEDIYREIKKDYTDIENLPDDKKEFIKSISYGGRLEKAKNKVEKYYGMLTKEQQEALINKTKTNDKQSNSKVETTQGFNYKDSKDIPQLTQYLKTLNPKSEEYKNVSSHINYVERNGITPKEKNKIMETNFNKLSDFEKFQAKHKFDREILHKKLVDDFQKKYETEQHAIQNKKYDERSANTILDRVENGMFYKTVETVEPLYDAISNPANIQSRKALEYYSGIKVGKTGKAGIESLKRIFGEDLINKIEEKQRLERENKAKIEQDKIDAENQKAKKEQRADDGVSADWLDTVKPILRTKAREILSKKIRFDGVVYSRKDLINKFAEEGRVFAEQNINNKSVWSALNRDGSYLEISKTEAMFGKWLNDNVYTNKPDRIEQRKALTNDKQSNNKVEATEERESFLKKLIEDGSEVEIDPYPKTKMKNGTRVIDAGYFIRDKNDNGKIIKLTGDEADMLGSYKKESKNIIEPNAHKGIDIRGLTELQKEERRVFRSQSEEIKNKIMNNDYEFKDGELIKGDTKIKVHDNLLEYAEQMQKEKIERVDYESRYTKYEALKGIDKDITYQEGLNAHRGTSFSPEQRARTEIASYIEDITSTYESLLKFADTPEKIEILDNEFSRFKEGYLKRKKVVLARRSNVVSSMIAGPANFPVRKMEKANNAVDNAMKEFYEYRDKAFTAISKKLRGQDTNIIKSNDADAISKLQDKLIKLESNHEMMKKANEVMRDKKLDTTQKYNKLKELGFSDKNIKNDIAPYGKFPQFSLTNNLQNIRTVKQRIAQLSKEKTIADNGGTKDILYKGARIHENFTDKRVQIFFDDIPNADIRTELKKRGFKWSPTSKAWQRSLGSDSKRYAQDALNNHFEKIENKTNFDETTANRYLKDEPTAMEKMENSIKNLEEC